MHYLKGIKSSDYEDIGKVCLELTCFYIFTTWLQVKRKNTKTILRILAYVPFDQSTHFFSESSLYNVLNAMLVLRYFFVFVYVMYK